MKKYLLLSGMLLVCVFAYAQREQAEYLEAKRLFNNAQYSSAKAAFSALSQSEVFGRHASFYFGLCAFQQEDFAVAKDMWRQVLIQFPTWDQKPQVLFWLAYANFMTGDFSRALEYSTQLTSETLNTEDEERMIATFISPLDLAEVDSLFSEYPDSKPLAEVLVKKLNAATYSERDIQRIDELVTEWGFDINTIAEYELPLVRKEVYNIAVVMPFLYESLQNTSLITQNSLVMDMYQGMLMAAEDLTKRGEPVNIFPYDTKRKASATKKILENKGFENTDLIIGPLYPEPNALVDQYSVANKINKFNPISSNSEVVGDNPFSFLMRPSYETMAVKCAEFAIAENKNPYAMIFYEQSARDSVFAAIYKQQLEEAGFEVVLFREITKDNSRQLLDTLWAQYDQYLTQEEADSIQEIRGRFVKSRRIRRDEMERMSRNPDFILPISYDDNQNRIVYYEKLFRIAPDSIGHILAATRSNLFANNLISAVETRGDSIRLYGYGDWLDFTMLSFNQLDRLGVALSDPDYKDRNSFYYRDFQERFIAKYKTRPSVNHLRGYELVYFAGHMMHQYGKYFQTDLRSGVYRKGRIFEGFRYGVANDNQVVPMVRFKDSKLEVVNREMYED